MSINPNPPPPPPTGATPPPGTKAGHTPALKEAESQDDSQPDIQDLLRDEFARLQREYRILEYSRHNFAHKEGGMKSKANHLLPILDQDRKMLRRELKIANSPIHCRRDRRFARCMQRILFSYGEYREAIEKILKTIKETEFQVDKITEKITKQKQKIVSCFGTSKTLSQMEWQLRQAEDRLYYVTCTCNLQLCDNKKLREEINDLLQERDSFFFLHRRVKLHLADTRDKMLRVVQNVTHTYDTRDEYITKMKALREREAKETKQFRLEMQELTRNLHHFKKSLNFVRTKCRAREVFENDKQKRKRHLTAREKELDTILTKYRDAFRKILEYSASRSIRDLLDKYEALDFDNFESFKYLTNINSECEVLREAVFILKSKIEAAHAEVEALTKEQRDVQAQLQLAIIDRDTEVAGIKKAKEKNVNKINDILLAIEYAFDLAECDDTILGLRNEITSNNYRLFFFLLDQKITEMKHDVTRYFNILNGEDTSAYSKFPKQHHSHGGPFHPKVIITAKHLDDEDSKILEEQPFYYHEIREYLYVQMVEEGLIDPSQRVVSVVPSRTQLSRNKSLIERVKVDGRRRRHTEQFNSRVEMEVRKRIGSMFGGDPASPSMTQTSEIESDSAKRRNTVSIISKNFDKDQDRRSKDSGKGMETKSGSGSIDQTFGNKEKKTGGEDSRKSEGGTNPTNQNKVGFK